MMIQEEGGKIENNINNYKGLLNNSNKQDSKIDLSAKSISGRSLSQGPSKSRAELLARRQQLAAANGPSTQLGWPINNNTNHSNNLEQHSIESDTASSSFESDNNNINGYSMVTSNTTTTSTSISTNTRQHQNGRSTRSQQRGSNNRGLSSEAKLESLSEQLRLHQAATANLPISDLNQIAQFTSNEISNQQQHNATATTTTTNMENVYILLAKKDKDLQLAAELGKVLLEKNDELSQLNEQQAEEYSRRLESLEEEKHKLRLRLEQLEADYENRLIDVQTDCRLLEDKLHSQREENLRREREKSRLIDELGQQSQRLSSELVEATRSEELLSAQVDQLKERLSSRGSHTQDQNVQVEALKSEIEIISQRKQDLERKLRLVSEERQQVGGALEETAERLLMMESLLCERDSRLRDIECELHELREASSWLSNQLDSMISLNERLASGSEANATANEATSSELDDRRSQLIDQLRELRLRTRTRTKATEMKLLIDKQQQQQQQPKQAHNSGFKQKLLRNRKLSRLIRPNSQATDEQGSTTDDDDDEEIQSDDQQQQQIWQTSKQQLFNGPEQCLAIYKLLGEFQRQLEQRRLELRCQQEQLLAKTSSTLNNSSQSNAAAPANSMANSNGSANADDSGISAAYDDTSSSSAAEEHDQQLLANDPKQWQSMLSDIKLLIEDLPCKSCHTLIGEGQKYQQLSRDFARLNEELRKSEEQKLKISSEQSELEAKVNELEELCATLKSDLDSQNETPDEIVRAAWKRRDEAVARKNACEIKLAKSRIENMQLSSQLMEVVQQKSQLAHQVAQFEDDMHYMTQHSVKAKFSWEEQAEKFRRDQKESRQQQLQQQQSSVVAGISLGPLTSLLGSFATPSSNSNATTTSRPNSANNTGSTNNNNGNFITNTESLSGDQLQPKGSIIRNFATSRLNLTRFWSNKTLSTSPTTEIATPSATTTATPPPPTTTTTVITAPAIS